MPRCAWPFMLAIHYMDKNDPQTICWCAELLVSWGRAGSFQDKCLRGAQTSACCASGKDLSLAYSKIDLLPSGTNSIFLLTTSFQKGYGRERRVNYVSVYTRERGCIEQRKGNKTQR